MVAAPTEGIVMKTSAKSPKAKNSKAKKVDPEKVRREIQERIDNLEKKPTARRRKTEVVAVDGVNWGVRTREGTRIASVGRGDRVAEELAKCSDVDSLVSFASEFLDPAKIEVYRDRAPNFGQFRMVIGNCIRGAINRAQREREKAAKA